MGRMRVGLFLLCMLATLFGLSAAMDAAHAVWFDPQDSPCLWRSSWQPCIPQPSDFSQ
jgi:hypothetical protein